MKLSNAILRPGTVIEVLENGAIKASAPGLFSSQDKEYLPPIYPFFINHSNSYSQPQEYDDVWILNMVDNPQQLYWFKRDNYTENNSDLLTEENVEILCNRESGLGWATLYFSDGSGWVIKNDDSKIQIRADGSIIMGMNWPHRTIDINSKCISIGSENESAHPAAYGDIVEILFEDILGLFKHISTVSMANPYTMAIGQAIISKLQGIQNNIPKLTSSHVKID